jgi:hypothetical protein
MRTHLTALAALLTAATHALAQPLPAAPAGVEVTVSHGIEFSTIGAPGNPAYWLPPGPGGGQPNNGEARGRVDYTYRLARTEVTGAQWVQFANAYARTFGGNLPENASPNLLGSLTARVVGYSTDGGSDIYATGGVFANMAARTSWRLSALYCNWLHNDRAETPAAFHSGAYEFSTFGDVTFTTRFGGTSRAFTDQPTRSPGARFWIPSYDEWIKGMHFDPNNPQLGVNGWREFAFGADVPPFGGQIDPEVGVDRRNFGPPGTPGAISGDTFVQISPGNLGWPVASYPNAQSPWGLFDGGGSVTEWTEQIDIRQDSDGNWRNVNRALLGAADRNYPFTGAFSSFLSGSNLGDFFGRPGAITGIDIYGLRLAAAIPAPSSLVLVVTFCGFMRERRRHLD